MTKFDIYQQQLAEREKRAANIKNLKDQLNEAKEILRELQAQRQTYFTYDQQQDVRTTQAEIKRINEFLEDEERAYNATFATDEEVAALVEKMNL